ncbi:MAG TPA: hypothetical protein PK358_13065 [Spirochaetota bacterium]|nr:hypothetical protein [Spirochaetota bacterium]HPJ35760.1 hypothetical protein [Spirochaetota bacterium]
MTDKDIFDFDPIPEDKNKNQIDDFFLFDEAPEINDQQVAEEQSQPDIQEDLYEDSSLQKRTSADFEPDMELILITAQSSMIIEGMKLISQHDFKSKNTAIFSEAIRGVELYMKILERNPDNYRKVMSMLASDQDCMDVQKITFNLYKNVYGELPDSDSQKLKGFELIRDRLQNGYYKSLIASSLINIKKYYLLSGTLDTVKIDKELKINPDVIKKEMLCYSRHINIARELIKSGNFEINKGMKGRELNVFIIKSSQLLDYYYTKTGNSEKAAFYLRLNENFKKYFVIR